jgi:hypothetical protein
MLASDDLRDLADKQAIRDQLYTYCRAVDRLDIPLGHSVFHEDSEVDYGPDYYRGPGRPVIDKICADHLHLTSHSHQVANILIALDGARAGSEAYVTGTMRMTRDGKDYQIFVRARYLDQWEKRGGQWGIVRREVAGDHDEIREVTSARPAFNSSRDANDPSYKILRKAES